MPKIGHDVRIVTSKHMVKDIHIYVADIYVQSIYVQITIFELFWLFVHTFGGN